MKNILLFFMLLFLVTNIAACNQSVQNKAIVEQIKPIEKVSSLPSRVSYTIAPYHAQASRSPFSYPENTGTFLTQFPLQTLRMAGVLRDKNKVFALIVTPDNRVYLRGIGDNLGQRQGKISAISDNNIIITETFKEGDHTQQRETVLLLRTSL